MGVTNDGKQVAETTSPLSAQTSGDTCINLNPPKTASKGFFNEAPLTLATEHTTDKTLFSDGNVIRLGEAIGPPSQPAHGWSGGGVPSGTYIMEARATKAATNLKVEGGPPTRDTDTTTQNHGNIPGQIVDPAKAAELKRLAEEAKKRCSIEKAVATCKHGREMGSAGDQRILEVVTSPAGAISDAPQKLQSAANTGANVGGASNGLPDGQTSEELIKFVATRTNTVQPGPADCILGGTEHTKWVITRKAGGGLGARTDEKHGDEMQIDNSWLCMGGSALPDMKSKKPTTEQKAERAAQTAPATKDQIQTRSREIRGLTDETAGRVQNTSGITGSQARQQAYAEDEARRAAQKPQIDAAKKVSIAAQVANQGINLYKFLDVWFFRKHPVRITVQGIACTGSQNVEILAFPAEKISFSLGQAEYELMQATFQRIKAFADFFANLGKTAGGVGFEFKIKFMEDPEVGISCQWKELTKKGAGLEKYQCNKAVSAFIKIKTIAGVSFEFYVSAAVFFNGLIPGSGWIVQYVLDYFGIEAKVGVKVEFALGVALEIKWNEYEEYEKTTFNPTLTLKVSFFVRLRYKDKFHAEGAVVIKGEPSFENFKMDKDAILKFDLKEGDIRIGFSGQLYVSVLWWERNEVGEWWPESWRYRYGKTELRPLRPIMALIKS